MYAVPQCGLRALFRRVPDKTRYEWLHPPVFSVTQYITQLFGTGNYALKITQMSHVFCFNSRYELLPPKSAILTRVSIPTPQILLCGFTLIVFSAGAGMFGANKDGTAA